MRVKSFDSSVASDARHFPTAALSMTFNFSVRVRTEQAVRILYTLMLWNFPFFQCSPNHGRVI